MKSNEGTHKIIMCRLLCSITIWILLITLCTVICLPTYAQVQSVPFLNQWPTGYKENVKNMNCGPTCCVMVNAAIRETSPTAKELMNVLDYLGGDHRQYFGWYKGYGVGNLVDVLNNYFSYPDAGYIYAKSFEELKIYLDQGIPVIANVSQVYAPNSPNHKFSDADHFIVIERYDWNTVFIVDPGRTQESNGRGQYPINEFNSVFKGPFVYPMSAISSGQALPRAQTEIMISTGHDSRIEGSWQQSLFGFTTMTFTFRQDGTMTIATLGYSLEGTYSTNGDRYTMDYVIPGYGNYSSFMESAFQESGMDPGIAGSGTFILSGDTLFLDGLQFMRIR